MSRALTTVLLLVFSNVFMTTAWYWHLKSHAGGSGLRLRALVGVIALSWLIALPEYALQVPANRAGHVNFGGPFTAPQLKVLQEAIALVVFTAFAVLYLREKVRMNDVIAFMLVMTAVFVSMAGRGAPLTE